MKRYIIKKVEKEISGLFSPEWEDAEVIEINKNNWEYSNINISTKARALYNDKGIFVKFNSDEHPVSVNCRKNNGDVFKDSTVEIFIAPEKGNGNYFNFEINAEGYALIGWGYGRKRIRIENLDFSRFRIQTEITDNGFSVFLFIPFDFMKEYVSEISKEMKGNFQKCGETTPVIHFLSAFEINSPEPDFHRPECFGDFILE